MEARIAQYMMDTEKKLLDILGAGSWPADVHSIYQAALRKMLYGYRKWEERWNSGVSEDDLWNNPILEALSAAKKSITERLMEVSIAPSFVGEVNTTEMARELLEDCLKGEKHHIPRQPRNTEIQKGHVFVSEENSSGIKEWDDGFVWDAVESPADFKAHVNDEGLYRNIWVFEVEGLKHQVVSYY
jgi:Gti1/Pac2 family